MFWWFAHEWAGGGVLVSGASPSNIKQQIEAGDWSILDSASAFLCSIYDGEASMVVKFSGASTTGCGTTSRDTGCSPGLKGRQVDSEGL
jgi:hypothetical protein